MTHPSKNLVHFSGYLKTPKFPSGINWPNLEFKIKIRLNYLWGFFSWFCFSNILIMWLFALNFLPHLSFLTPILKNNKNSSELPTYSFSSWWTWWKKIFFSRWWRSINFQGTQVIIWTFKNFVHFFGDLKTPNFLSCIT